MDSVRMDGETRVVGGAQAGQPEYRPLSIRDMPAELTLADGSVKVANAMVTAWLPTQAELDQLNAGHPILLSILGDRWPPANIWVSDCPVTIPPVA